MEHCTQDEQFRQIIRARLGDYRYRHSLCVAQESARLAEKYGADPAKLYTAGLLHDIMKDTDQKTPLQILQEWHARTGAAVIQHVRGVEDPVSLQAVRYHTTGRAGMSLPERVLFVADFTSADREYPDVDTMRRLADESLEAAMEYGIAYTIRDLLAQSLPVHPDTLAAYNDIILSKTEGGHLHEQQ